MKVTFLGATGEVTGSCYLVEGDGLRFLVDCGMFQGGRAADAKNRKDFAFVPHDIDFMVLTHAHIDHSGLIPRLCKDGFKGPIYTTEATTELLMIMLRDSANIHEREAERANRKRKNKGHISKPLYEMADAEASLAQVVPKPYDDIFSPHDNVRIRLRDAGHILGSAILEIWLKDGGGERKITFSGDLGQPGRPILRDPCLINETDYLVVESTYGDRLHKSLQPSLDELVEIIKGRMDKGNIIVPAFAVGRTQELIYYLYNLTRQGRVKNLTVFLDSPMAQNVTDLTRRHMELFDKEGRQLAEWYARSGHALTLKFTRTVQESMAINSIRSGAIIMSASGMCTAGRILHHLRHGLARPNNTVLITGYQAQGTLGRRLVDGAKTVKIFGDEIAVKARIVTIGGFSAHADQAAILKWLGGFEVAPRQTFITHGEPEASVALSQEIKSRLGWNTVIPVPGQQVMIEA
ncbi:MAG: MBL fold metallo-hydrolase [Alphaproteobacteria bacterium]|nr:MBL fold metallo-hydrolase [Alphaproteobacteria bacterium]